MKRGFTLIELLAVISLLAIVALIATPIILNVIDDSKESANLRSIEGYARAIKQEYYNQSMDGSIPVIDETFLNNVEKSGGDVICENILYSSDNGVIMYKCKFENKDKEYCYADEKHYTCYDNEFLEIYNRIVNGTLEGTPIIEKVKELVYDNGACKTDGTTYQYMGGCYIKGKQNNNYIWYSGFLWRIMGINADGTVRLITDENVTAIPYHESSSNWDESYAKDWLNNYFYPRLKGNNIIKEETWCNETATDNSSERTTCTNNLSKIKSKVGMLTLDEYNLAGGSISYLDIAQFQWTMTPKDSSDAWSVGSSGYSYRIASFPDGVRAVINVNSDATITGGNGTLEKSWNNDLGPFILNEDKSVEMTGKLNEKVTSGEYVLFAGKKYRIIGKDSNGNTKLILDGYYEENENIFKMKYNDTKTNVFSKDTGIGQKLNGDVLNWLTNNNESEKAKLVSDYTWYQNNFDDGYNYKISLEEENPTRSIQATVGLIRVGEMLSGQSSSILTKGYTMASSNNNVTTYWIMMSSTTSSFAWYINDYGYAGDNTVSINYGLRPVIVIKSNVEIIGGNGTWSNPYQI